MEATYRFKFVVSFFNKFMEFQFLFYLSIYQGKIRIFNLTISDCQYNQCI
jgi:hypothetical protein